MMQKRCNNCFNMFEDTYEMCPHCGYVEGEAAEIPYILYPGTQLKGGKYIVGEKRGQGGFGIVYKAWDAHLQRVVAIKEFFPQSMVKRSDGQKEVAAYSVKQEQDYRKALEKFRREARIMSRFTDSVNCIQTYDVFEENGTAYIVMEYYDAPTLKEYIKVQEGKMLPEKEVLVIISQVLSGVQEIHDKGVFHLDIALDNIFIKKDGEDIKLCIYDFGAACLERDKKRYFDEDIVVKPGFAPPEQYKRNGKIGPWTDMYAVGANMYYLLTGVVPIEATDREHKDILEEPAQLTMVSPAINNTILRAMALNHELRYKNAKEFLEDLKKERVRSVEEEAKRRRRIRNSFIAAVSAVFVLAAVAIGFTAYTKGKIYEDEITVWIVAELDAEEEKARYEAVVKAFREYYPQIRVNVEAIEKKEVEQRFLSAPKSEKPDLIETTYASDEVVGQCRTLSSLLSENKEVYIDGFAEDIVSKNKKRFPLGIYVSLIYKKSGTELENLSEVSLSEFMDYGEGYIESDTTIYATVQGRLAGRYEIAEGERKKANQAELFSVYSRSINKEKAAKALLSYMLTDVGQETLHITNVSDYLPITQSMFELYVGDIFSELYFLEESIGQYKLR